MNRCIYCNSSNIRSDIELAQSAEVGAIGLHYQTKFLFLGVEPLVAELCQDCGSINRLYVKNTDKKWVIKE